MYRVVLLKHLEYLETCADDRRSQRVREEIRTAALAQHVDNLLAASCESTESAAESLAQCAGVDIHTTVCLAQFAHAVARSAYNASRVRLVYHYESVVLLCQVADLVHRSDVAVHREHTVGADDAEALSLSLLQALLQFLHVGVGVAVALSLAQTHAVDDRSVVECVRDDSVLVGEERAEQTTVGVEAGSI